MSNEKKLNDIRNNLIELADEGEAICREHKAGLYKDISYNWSLDESFFIPWKSKTIDFLNRILPDSHYTKTFENEVTKSNSVSVKTGINLLKDIIKNLNSLPINYYFEEDEIIKNINFLENIFDRFSRIHNQLQNRRGNRETLTINDEYDVQDLLHALLHLNFDNIKKEEPTPSDAGNSKKIDFLIKDINTGIEVKHTRTTLKENKIGDELKIDLESYFKHPDCKNLIFFIYDPDGLIGNRDGFKEEIEEKGKNNIKVFIEPKL